MSMLFVGLGGHEGDQRCWRRNGLYFSLHPDFSLLPEGVFSLDIFFTLALVLLTIAVTQKILLCHPQHFYLPTFYHPNKAGPYFCSL